MHLRYFGASTIDMCLNEMSELPCWQLGRQDLISGKLIMPSTERDVLYAYVQSGVVWSVHVGSGTPTQITRDWSVHTTAARRANLHSLQHVQYWWSVRCAASTSLLASVRTEFGLNECVRSAAIKRVWSVRSAVQEAMQKVWCVRLQPHRFFYALRSAIYSRICTLKKIDALYATGKCAYHRPAHSWLCGMAWST